MKILLIMPVVFGTGYLLWCGLIRMLNNWFRAMDI